MSHDPVITVRALKKSYGALAVLHGIDLTILSQELTVFIGPSGCGKSTLLKCLNGLEPFQEGGISIHGLPLDGTAKPDKRFERQALNVRREVGMVFQSFNLFPHLTLLENVMKAPRVVKGVSEDEARATALALLEKVGLSKHTNHKPVQLSGGQQQRGAIARALAMDPKVLLYDEPTSALDPGLTDEVFKVMRDLDADGMTQIVVTHEMRFARDIADRVIFLDHGVIVEDAAPEVMFKAPKDERTRAFLKRELGEAR